MAANERQVGGDHYRKEYQHWDFVCDIQLHYLLGCATKYVFRWREKNGVEDLNKSVHYIQKAEERGIRFSAFSPQYVPPTTENYFQCANRFLSQCHDDDKAIIQAILDGRYLSAAMLIEKLISQSETTPTRSSPPQLATGKSF
jgi:hypothetical protein